MVEGENTEQCTKFVAEELKLNLTNNNGNLGKEENTLHNQDDNAVFKRADGKNISLGQVSDDSQMAMVLMV